MFEQEDIQHLQGNEKLQQLLNHYAELGQNDRKNWQDRLMEMAGLAPAQITRLHGELLAFEWVEQNVGAARASYRITPSGIRALKRALHGTDEDEAEVAADEPTPKIARKRRSKKSDESTGEQAPLAAA